MTQHPTQPAREIANLRRDVATLRETVQLLEEQRDVVMASRRRRLAFVAGGLSLLCHIALMIYLSSVNRVAAGTGGTAEVAYEFAILDEAELTGLGETSFDTLEADEASSDEQVLSEQLSPSAPAVETGSASPSSVPTLGGSGEGGFGMGGGGEGLGLGGGGGGMTSFFGVGAKGQRFAYIVDISGSMGQEGKLDTAMRELARSIDSLPDYAHFYIVLFNSSPMTPPMQEGWMRAQKATVRRVIRWLGEIDPSGGTQPRGAFLQVFGLEVRPDVIFFLTDGLFEDITADEIASLNGRRKRTVINTIAFGDQSGEELLKKIAKQSGGLYRYQPTRTY